MAEIDDEELQAYVDQQISLAQPTEEEPLEAPVEEAQVEFRNWDYYTSDPEYSTLSTPQKQEIFDSWKTYATQYLAENGDLKTSADIDYAKQYFSQISETEKLSAPSYEVPSYAEQLIGQAQSGLRSFESGVAGYGALVGAADPELAAQAIASRRKEEQDRYVSPELKAYGEKQLGFLGASLEIVSNPFDIALPFFAQSMGSNLAAMAGSLGLAGAGAAVAGPPGAAVAGLYGSAVLGGATDALVTVDQLVAEEVQKRGLDPSDAEAIKSVLIDPEFKTRALTYANARGLAIGATGLASFGLGSIIAAPVRAGVGSVAKEVAKQLAVQTIAEPVGEIAAQVGAQVATGQPVAISGREVAEETLIGLPMAGVEAGVMTYKNLAANNSPSSANQVLENQVTDFRKEEIKNAVETNSLSSFYGNLSLGEKAKILGLAPNAVLLGEQNIFETLSEADAGKVRLAFGGAKEAIQPPILGPESLVATPAETQPPVLTPELTIEQLQAETQKAFEAPLPETTAPITEDVKAPLSEIAPASAEAIKAELIVPVTEIPAQVVAPVAKAPTPEAPAPVVEQPKVEAPAPAPVVVAEEPAPVQPLTKKFLEEGIKNVSGLDSMSRFFNEILKVLGRSPTREEEASLAAFIEGRISVDGLPSSLISEEQAPVSQLTDFGRLRQTVEKATGKKVTPAPVSPAKPFVPAKPILTLQDRIEYYRQRLEDVFLLAKAITVGEDLLVPTGGKRKIGLSSEYNSEREAKDVLSQIQGKPGFENAKIRESGLELGFDIIWGDQQTINDLEKMSEQGRKLLIEDKLKALPERWRFLGNAFGYKQSEIDSFTQQGLPPKVTTGLVSAPAPAPATKKLPPTKTQVTALTKLGYLPADIEALDRVQAKDILAKKIKKVETPKETQDAQTGIGAETPTVPPAPIVKPTPTEPTQPPIGETGLPLASTEDEIVAEVTLKERLDLAEETIKKVAEKLQSNLTEANIKLDKVSTAQFLGLNPNPEVEARLNSLLRILNTALANVKQELLKKGSLGRGRNIKGAFLNIDKIIIDPTARGGGGLYADPRNPLEAGTLYLNPDQLARALLLEETTNPADFLVTMLTEEILHANDGKAMVMAFVKKFPSSAANKEIYSSPEATVKAFQEFYDQNNREIENSLTLPQIKEVLGKYIESLGIDTAGKSKEQIIAEFNVSRTGSLAEEYVRALIQRAVSGKITEDTIKRLTTKPTLRFLGALRNFFKALVGPLGTKQKSRKTKIDERHDAILSLLVESSPKLLREAAEEANTAIPGKQLASSANPFADAEAFDNKTASNEMFDRVNKEYAPETIQRKLVEGGLVRAFPTIRDKAVIQTAINDALREAMATYDDQKDTSFSTYVFRIAKNDLLRAKRAISARRQREISFQSPGVYSVSRELQRAEKIQGEMETASKPRPLTEEEKTKRRQKLLETPTDEATIGKEMEKEEEAVVDAEKIVTSVSPAISLDEPIEFTAMDLGSGEKISSLDFAAANRVTADMKASQNALAQKLGDALQKLQNRTNVKTAARDAEIIQYVSGSSAKTRSEISEQYELSNDQFTKIRDDLMAKLKDILLQTGVTKADVRTKMTYASSVDPNYSQAMSRAISTLPQSLREALSKKVILSFTDEGLTKKANAFVDANSPNNEVMYAKRILDGNKAISAQDRIAALGVIGVRLRNALRSLDLVIEGDQKNRGATTRENLALKEYLEDSLVEVIESNEELGSRAGQSLRAQRTIADMYYPLVVEKQYVKPVFNQQKEVLQSKEEVRRAQTEIVALKKELAAQAVGDAFNVGTPSSPDEGPKIVIGARPEGSPSPEGESFYQLLAAFGDMTPVGDELFSEYLERLGVPYDELLSVLEGMKAASVSPSGPRKILPENLRSLSAKEALKQLLNIDKNLLNKIVSLRIKTGTPATTQNLQANFESRKLEFQDRPLELQTVFDFFNSTASEKPTEPRAPIKDNLPVIVQLAKYAADAVTGRVLRSLGADLTGKTKDQQGALVKVEKDVRRLVNAQFRQEIDPKQVSKEDTRSAEQRLLDVVQRVRLSEDVFNQVQGNLRNELAQDNKRREMKTEGQLNDTERNLLQSAIDKTFNANAVNSLDNLLQKIIDFKAEARKHMSQRGVTILSLSNIVKDKFPNFTEKQTESLAKLLAARYQDLVKKKGASQLENIVRRVGDKATQVPKKRIEQILELINLGAFNEEKFYNAIAERYNGIPTWDPEVVTEIRKRADALQKLPPNSDQAATGQYYLQAYMAKELHKQETGWEKNGRRLDVASALWKAGVLSGPPTQLVNLGATNLNILFELLSEANAYKKASKQKGFEGGFFSYLGTALSAYIDAGGKMGLEQASDVLSTGLSRSRNLRQIELTPLETFNFDTKNKWSLNNYLSLWKMVGRAMGAADTYNSAIASDAKAKMAARYALLADGLTPAQATAKSEKIFDLLNPEILQLREQVSQEESEGQFGSLEGIAPNSFAYSVKKRAIEAGKRRRFNQLRENYIITESKIGEAGLEKITKFSQIATFNNQPEGLIGYLGGEIVGGIAGKVKLLTPFAAFPRTIANIINSGLNYTPYGFARARGFSLGNFSGAILDSDYKFKTPEPGSIEFHQLETKAFYGSLVTFLLVGLALRDMDKDWDDAFFAVTGRGPTDVNQKEQLLQSGWRENSVKMGPLRFRHTDFPGLNTIFGAMALFSDQSRYGKLSEKDLTTVATTAALSIGNSIFDKQLLSGAKTLFDAFSDRGDTSEKAKRVIQAYTGGFLNPGIARWLNGTLRVGPDGMVGVQDFKELNATSMGWLLGLTPLAVLASKPKLNRLGEEIKEYPFAATEKRFGLLPTMKPHPVFTPLIKAGLFVPGASINLKIKDFEGGKPVQRKMDRAEYYNYSKYNGEYLRRSLTPNRAEFLAKMAGKNQDLAQKQLENMADRAKDYAKARIEQEIRQARRTKTK